MVGLSSILFVFFFNDTATTEIYTLSLHDALPISARRGDDQAADHLRLDDEGQQQRSEEHTSELQSHVNLVCRLLLEKKNNPTRLNSILIYKQRTCTTPKYKK